MNIKRLLSDDEGVSPVIGVILMVAITVILAAVIAAFVLGLGDSSDVSPQTSFDFDYEEGAADDEVALTITATSGDTVDAAQLEIEGDSVDDADLDEFTDEVTAGSTATIEGSGVDTGDTINVVWESEDGDDSSILASFDVPDN